MKNTIKKSLLALTSTLALSSCTIGERSAFIEPQYWNLGTNHSYTHQTHPDDLSFLGSGSAGTTHLRHAGALALGTNLSGKTSSLEPYIGASLLVIYCEDVHQNENDSRDKNHCSKIFSDFFPITGQATAGINFHPLNKRLAIGPSISATPILERSGWDRYNKRETDNEFWKLYLNAGGKVGCDVGEGNNLNLKVEKGLNSEATTVSVGIEFLF